MVMKADKRDGRREKTRMIIIKNNRKERANERKKLE
jgi:hypothetical protein